MSTKSISILEAEMTVMKATVRLLQEEIAEMKRSGGGTPSAEAPKRKGERKKRDPDAPKPERSEKQKAQDEKREQIKAFLSDEQKKELKEAGYKGNVVFSLSAYISENNDGDDISAEMVAAAVNYLVENPDYKSKTQKERSEKGSVTGSDSEEKVEKKKPGRPKAEKSPVTSDGEEKVEKAEKKTRGRPKKEKAEKDEKKIEVVDPSDDGDEKAEEWEFAGEQYYKLGKSNAVIDTDFEYVGIYDGKKIDRKAEMPASVKKYLEQFN